MWSGSVVKLDDWSEFAARLVTELNTLGRSGLVAVRNFEPPLRMLMAT